MTRAQTARSALRLFRQRQWALALVGVVALSVVFVLLGRWQYHRHEGKVERRDLVEANYASAPVPLGDLLPFPNALLDPGDVWCPATVSGRYLPEATVLVRNRPLDGEAGYEVLVPLQLADGTVLIVDRGWVPAGSDARRPDVVPAPPLGSVEVTVRLRPGEPPLDRAPPPGQALRIDLPGITEKLRSQGLDGPVHRAYGVLADEVPDADPAPVLLPRPDVGLGVNLAYAVQWWAFALAAYVLLGVGAVREVRRREASPADRCGRAPAAAGSGPVAG